MLPKIILAPLSGCTDLPFRLIAREHGAKLCFFEMLDSNSLTHNRRQSYWLLTSDKKDAPIAGQILGSDPDIMLEAAHKVLDRARISFLDINCACPAKKVIKKKAGAHLLRDETRLYDILKKLVPALPVPITIKIRAGYDTKDLGRITSMVKRCEDLGVAVIFVHGRLAKQGYAGDVDYGSIKAVKESVKIPVYGSGNIFSRELMKKMFDETGCDGVLVARGALGNPSIFEGVDPDEVSVEDKKKILKKHLSYIDKYKPITQSGKIGYMRKVAIWYLKSVPMAARLRSRITSAKSYENLLEVIR